MDWNGAALTLMPPLCKGLEPVWNACVSEAGGGAVDGGGCSVMGIEAYIKNNLYHCIYISNPRKGLRKL